MIHAIELHHPACDSVVGAKLSLPQSVAQQDDFFAAGSVLVGSEISAAHRLDAQRGQERGGDARGADPLRLVATRQVVGGISEEGRDMRERVAPCVQVIKIPAGKLPPVLPFNKHQPFRISERQRAEQHRVEHVEHGGVRPDAQRQREHGHDGEAGIL